MRAEARDDERGGLVGEEDGRAELDARGGVEAELRDHRVARARDVEDRSRARGHVAALALLVRVVDALGAERDHGRVERGELHELLRALLHVLEARQPAAERLLGLLAVGRHERRAAVAAASLSPWCWRQWTAGPPRPFWPSPEIAARVGPLAGLG